MAAAKVLMVGPYPPPEGGWSTAIREEREELESRGVAVRVLNTGPNRRVPGEGYLSVRGAGDLALQLLRHGAAGYVFRLHMNGDSMKGLSIVLAACAAGALRLHRPCLSFHAGVSQRWFPHRGNLFLKALWTVVFSLPRAVICDNDEVREIIAGYRIGGKDVHGISPFSRRRVEFVPEALDPRVENFVSRRGPLLFSYFAYRPEYSLEMLFDAVEKLREKMPSARLLAVDDRSHPDSATFSSSRAAAEGLERSGAMLRTGELGRDAFLTAMSRSDIFVRTPLTDGVCSSVLEAIHLGVTVVAADNGSRPPGVRIYDAGSLEDMVSAIERAVKENEDAPRRAGGRAEDIEDSVARLADTVMESCGLRSAGISEQPDGA